MKTYTVTAIAGIIAGVVAALVLAIVLVVGNEGHVPPTPSAAAQVPPNQSILPKLTPVAQLQMADPAEVHAAYAPNVPPPVTRSDQRIFEVHLEIVEAVCDLDPANGVKTEKWGYRIAGDTTVTCGAPGPVLRGRVGDVARITVTNLPTNKQPHNIDFHAVTGQGGGAAALTVLPGESATIEVRLLYPGAFMYHCAAGDVPQHIAHGMYGMFIVDPEKP
ncbi:MAG: multicopper oxidase domain-containing protein, partial [Chloroflexota bacterium]|nr:multicopper oxidase domain-containing protein [Chloroflexota bacterium]